MPSSPAPDPPLLHVLAQSDWEALTGGTQWQPPSLGAEGFVHLCRPEQLEGVLVRWFAGREDLVILELNPSLLEARIEWAELPHGSFPHLMGPLNLSAVTATRRPGD